MAHRGPGEQLARRDHVEPLDAVEATDHVVVDDGDGRRGPLGDAPQVGVGEPVVQRGEGAAGLRRREQGDRDGERVDAELDGAATRSRQRPGGRDGGVAQLGVGQLALRRGDGAPVAHRVGGHVEQQRQVHGRQVATRPAGPRDAGDDRRVCRGASPRETLRWQQTLGWEDGGQAAVRVGRAVGAVARPKVRAAATRPKARRRATSG